MMSENLDEEITYVYQCLHNPNNRFITFEDLKTIFQKANILEKLAENKINIHEFNLKDFQKAFTHISYTTSRHKKQGKNIIEKEDENVDVNLCIPIQEDSMEKLEWLGDAIIQSVVGTYLWKRFPNQDEGFLTKTRSKLVKTEALGRYGKYLDFGNMILVSKHIEDYCNGRNNPKHLEDCFEAFVGVLYEQTCNICKYDIVTDFILNLIEKIVDLPMLILNDDNYKDQLMKYYQKTFKGKCPTYSEVKVEEIPTGDGETNSKKKIFTMCTNDIYGQPIAYGKAKSKKDAAQLSAKEACRIFGLPVFDNISYYFY